MKALLLASLLFAVACESDREAPDQQHQAQLTGKRPRHMQNCPSAVPSARTYVARRKDGVDVTILSNDPAARQKIASLASLEARRGEPMWLLPPHSGMHGGPGTIGFCPIIHADTSVSVERVRDGVRIHVAARDERDAAKLQEATEARVRAMTMASS